MNRLNTKLDALELRTGSDGTLSQAEKQLLVAVLARRDALFWPWRFCQNYQPPIPEIRHRQREYLAGVEGIAAKGSGTQSDWKSAHELRRSLIAAEHLTSTSSGGQVTSVFLTPAGEAVARSLVGSRLATHRSAWIHLELLRVLAKTPGAMVRESILFGLPCVGSPCDWQRHVEQVLPLLTAGTVEAVSDTNGRILFREIVGVELPEFIPDVRQAEQGFDSLYVKSFNSERAALEAAEQRDPAEIHIPIGASDHWPDLGDHSDEK